MAAADDLKTLPWAIGIVESRSAARLVFVSSKEKIAFLAFLFGKLVACVDADRMRLASERASEGEKDGES